MQLLENRQLLFAVPTPVGPEERHDDLEYLVDALDWDSNVDPSFKDHHYLEPIPVADTASEGYVDRWVVYGTVGGRQLFSAKELTVDPGAGCTISDTGAYGWITVQGSGQIGPLALQTPAMIRYGEMTDDEVFVTAPAAAAGVRIENTGTEPLVSLRYFGPDAKPDAPSVGDHK